MASFKTDESFLEKISIGAIGTQKVFDFLKALGHQPIELERGSMNYKIWKKIKIKRIRVPDILCVDNGIRIESRAKTKLEVSMSHSTSDPERGWDAGMNDSDYIAFVHCEKAGKNPVDWKADSFVQFISVKDLRESEKSGKAVLLKAKGAQEGFEARIVWPIGIASVDGVVTEIGNTLKYQATSGKKYFARLSKQGKELIPLVRVGDKIHKNQIIASVTKVSKNISAKKVNVDYFIKKLTSLNLSERYASVKALSYFNQKKVIELLKNKLEDSKEHIYVRLEAAASLCRLNIADGYVFLILSLKDQYTQNVLETVIVLSEIKTKEACAILCDVLLNKSLDSEIRAGAAWGLGEQQNRSAIETIVKSFNSVDENIKIEAARALSKLTKLFSEDILTIFAKATTIEMPGVAWALSKSKKLNVEQLMAYLKDNNSRIWVSYILGMQGEEKYINEIEKLRAKDPEVYFAVTLLWKLITSWIYELKEY